MKKLFLLNLLAIFFYLKAGAEVQLYTALIGGSVALSDSQGVNSYNHESQFFTGHLGGSFGAGYMFTTGVIGLGLKGEISWMGNSMDKKDKNTAEKQAYRFESQRLLTGLTFSLRPGPVSIDFEYYLTVNNVVSYSDEKAQNPFRKGDNLKGTGYGVGFAFKFFPPMRNFMMFRKLNYQSTEMNGISKSLPDDQYSLLKFDEIVLGFGSEF